METKEKKPTAAISAPAKKKPVKRVESDRDAIRENRKKLLTRKSAFAMLGKPTLLIDLEQS